jgi:hypothetical protein
MVHKKVIISRQWNLLLLSYFVHVLKQFQMSISVIKREGKKKTVEGLPRSNP